MMLVVASFGMRLIAMSITSLLSSVSSCLTDLHASCMACSRGRVNNPVRWYVQRYMFQCQKPALAAGTLNTAHELHTLVRHVCQADVSMSHSEGTWTHLCNGFTDVIKNDGAGEPIGRRFPRIPRPHGRVCQQYRSYFHVVQPLQARPSHASPGQLISAPACCRA